VPAVPPEPAIPPDSALSHPIIATVAITTANPTRLSIMAPPLLRVIEVADFEEYHRANFSGSVREEGAARKGDLWSGALSTTSLGPWGNELFAAAVERVAASIGP
jgi:hypothetical protein